MSVLPTSSYASCAPRPAALPAPTSKWRVLVVDDHPITRRGLVSLVERSLSFVVCAEASTAEEALTRIEHDAPHVVVLDISLPDMNGIDLTAQLRVRPDAPRILIVSMHDEDLYAEWSLLAGAQGYLRKDESRDMLGRALEQIMQGGVYLSPALGEKILATTGRRSITPRFSISSLSKRESEVLGLLGDGWSTRKIAEILGLSTKTVDSYREHLKIKLGLADAHALIRYAINWRHRDLVAGASLKKSGEHPRAGDPAGGGSSDLAVSREADQAGSFSESISAAG